MHGIRHQSLPVGSCTSCPDCTWHRLQPLACRGARILRIEREAETNVQQRSCLWAHVHHARIVHGIARVHVTLLRCMHHMRLFRTPAVKHWTGHLQHHMRHASAGDQIAFCADSAPDLSAEFSAKPAPDGTLGLRYALE